MTTLQHASALVDRAVLADRFRQTRRRSAAMFDLLSPDAYSARPIALRHPIVFYEGHLAAFNVNTLVKKALGRNGADEALETLFARGIDPSDAGSANRARPPAWPSRTEIAAFVREADRLVLDALATAALDRPGHPLLDRGEAVYAILEHEEMHQETLGYMWHRLPFAQKREPEPAQHALPTGPAPRQEVASVPAGRATLGARPGEMPFGWDNEFQTVTVEVGAFEIDRFDVTNGAFLEFVEAGGYRDPRWWSPGAFAWLREDRIDHPTFWIRGDKGWAWRGMFREIPLPAAWPVFVSQAEAAAYARWRGRRLPTEAEFHRAAFGVPSGDERPFPWGDAAPTRAHGCFDFASWDPAPVGSYPAGRSAFGVDDLVGNGWEWTSTVFAPFPGFTPLASYPEYSADFFDGQHFVLKGASPATAHGLLRRSFRNWFRPHYPYVYAAFRCAADAG